MLRLRPYKACDAEAIVTWIQDETTFYKWSAGRMGPYPITAEYLNTYYESFAFADHFFVMTAFDDSGIVGQMMMRFLDEEKQILRFGFIIVDGEKRGRGYGKGMLELAIQYAFEMLKVERITIGVFENNEPAYRCYKSLGFQDTGRVEVYTLPNEVRLSRRDMCYGVPEGYEILGEEWKCRELELRRE